MVFKNVSKLFLIIIILFFQCLSLVFMCRENPRQLEILFCQPSQSLPIYRIFARGLSQIFPIMNLAGDGKCFDSVDQVVH